MQNARKYVQGVANPQRTDLTLWLHLKDKSVLAVEFVTVEGPLA